MRAERQKKQFTTWIILVTVVLSMTLIVISAVAGEKQIEKSTYTVIVGTELDYPPYSFLDEKGNSTGFNVELSQAIAKVMGLNIEIQIRPWGDIRKALETGKIDAIYGMYYSEERDKLVDFSPPYTIVHHAVFARKDFPKIKSEDELRGKEIIVMRGDIMHDYVLEKGLSKSPALVDTQADALRVLASGKHDCALIAKLPGLYWTKKLGLSNIVTVGPLLRPSDYSYAVTEGNAQLLAKFVEGLAIVKQTNRYKEIYDKWLGVLKPRGVALGTIFKYIALFVVPLLLLLAFFITWSRMLKRQVDLRTKDLREREENLRTTLNSIGNAIIVTDIQGNITRMNPVAEKLTGWEIADSQGKLLTEVFNIVNAQTKAKAVDPVSQVLEKGKIVGLANHTMFIAKDSTEYQIADSAAPIKDDEGNLTGVVLAFRDVTQEYKMQEALRESEEKYRLLVENLSCSVYRGYKDWSIEFFDEKIELITGYDADEFNSKRMKWNNIIIEEDIQTARKSFIQALKTDKSYIREYRIKSKIEDIHWIQERGQIVCDSKGEIEYVDGVFFDVTDRKQAEEELEKSHALTKSLINSTPDLIFAKSCNFDYLLCNNAFTEFIGRPEDRIIGYNDTHFFPDLETVEFFRREDRKMFASSNPLRIEEWVTYPDGRKVFFETLKSPYYSEEGELLGLIGVSRNITEQYYQKKEKENLQAKLQRSQKMESLGLLAGGVGHDLNNVLSGIVSYPELLLLDLPEDSKLRKPIETIQKTGHRATAIVQDLLTVARGVAITKKPLNLNDLVSDYLDSPEFEKVEQFHPTVTIKTNLDTDLFNVSGSSVHIRKVVMNLVSNASEAIERVGNVTISTMNRYEERPLRGYDDVNIGEYAVLSVSDDGSGISSDDLERIFEPFYTKKVMGRSGTGLGLAVVWNVVQDHKGYINVTSDENGTTFELYFPITRDEISDKELSVPVEDFKGDGETVLVVDDVESQRDISCKMLDRLGYKTVAVSSGEEAVEYLKEHTVDLILLDMIMDPGINGRETYEQIIKIHPNQKAVIASGFAETDDVKEAQRLGAGQYIKKPLTLEKIGIVVRDELKK